MKAITVQISDEDYNAVVEHFAADRIGKPLVGVIGLPNLNSSGSIVRQDIVDRAEELNVIPTILQPGYRAADTKDASIHDRLIALATTLRDETMPSGEPGDADRQLAILRDQATRLLDLVGR